MVSDVISTIIWIIIHLDVKFLFLGTFSILSIQIFDFSSLTVMICLGIILYKFILFGIYWSFGTDKCFLFPPDLANFRSLSSKLFCPNLASFLSETLIAYMPWNYPCHWGPDNIFSVFFLSFSNWIISIDLYSTSLKFLCHLHFPT